MPARRKDDISDHDILVLIHKNIDVKKMKEQDKRITKRRVDELFQNIINDAKDDQTISDKEITDTSNTNKKIDLIVVNVDGASRGNPGESGIGVAIFDKDSNLINEAYDYLGTATNNIAEYKALILGIKLATEYAAGAVLFKSDSELMVKQINGVYRVKNTRLKLLFIEVQNLLKKLPNWKIMHVRREKNQEADLLANKGVDTMKKSW